MEVDDSEVGSECTSSESYDGEPAAMRRRLDIKGSFATTDHHRRANLPSDNRTSEYTAAVPPAKEDDDHSGSDESLLEVTLTSQQECDTGPSVVDTSHDCSFMSASYVDLAEMGVGQELVELDIATSSTVSTQITSRGGGSRGGTLPSIPLCISEGASQIRQQDANTFTCTRDQWKIYREAGYQRKTKSEDGGKDSSETDLSCANSSSGDSSSGFYGDVDEADYTGSLASSADLLETYDNVKEAFEMEKQREEDTVNLIGSCLEKVSSKIGHLQEIASKVLSNYRMPDAEALISEAAFDTVTGQGSSSTKNSPSSVVTGIPSSHHASVDEVGNPAQVECKMGGENENDTSSEHGSSCEERFVAVKAYVLIAPSNYVPENGNSSDEEEQRRVPCETVTKGAAVTASTRTSVSTTEDDRASTRVQLGTSEETASNRSHVDSEWTDESDQEGNGKKLQNACKLARTSRKVVARQHGIMSHISAIAEQRLRKINVTCLTIMNCVKGTANVACTALGAKRVARLSLQQATARSDNTVFQVAEAASSTSRFAREAVAFAERAVQLHREALEALTEARALLDGIQFEEGRGRDLSRQVSAFGDEMDKLMQQTANISLDELSDKKSVVASSRGAMSFALIEVKEQSTSIENLAHRCDRVLSDVLKVLQRGTSSSVKAITAALEALETFGSDS
ncbi:uncharacterized protein LOC126146350 [Schistocerca cancellata]|uniref:uncharacterized protein LOC126146350 n=1 Tax=Schistocerca cancellata TaxID=274614 RepID=UPI002118ACA1|nr:uncharacterized protein LOC126146350 [Schistocerca cancellata]